MKRLKVIYAKGFIINISSSAASCKQNQHKKFSPRGKQTSAYMSARPSIRPAVRHARPIFNVQDRFLAWDKPQFFVENSSRERGPSPAPRIDSPKNHGGRDVKLTVTRSVSRHSSAALRGRGMVAEDRFGNSPKRIPNTLNSNPTKSKPVIISDLWKPMHIKRPTDQAKVSDLNDNASGVPHNFPPMNAELNRPMTGYEKYNTRTEAQQLLRNSRSAVHQFLRSPSASYTDKNYNASPNYHGNRPLTATIDRIGQVASYHIYNSTPKTNVYNLNEYIVSSSTDLSSSSSFPNERKINSTEQNASKCEGRSVRWKDNIVDNGNRVMSGMSNITLSCHAGMAKAGNKVETHTPQNGRPNKTMLLSIKRIGIKDKSQRECVDKTVDSDSSVSSPISLDEISEVGRENGLKELPQARSMCPMCRTQAAIKEASSVSLGYVKQENMAVGKPLDTGVEDTSFVRTESSIFNEGNVHGNQHDCIREASQSPRELGAQRIPETSQYMSFPSPKPDNIDSYGKNVELSSNFKVSSHSKPADNHRACIDLSIDLKTLNSSGKYTANSRRNNTERVPKKRSGMIAVNGNGLTCANDLERYRPSPLHSRKWYVDAAHTMPQTTLRNAQSERAGASQIPLYMSKEAMSVINHRVPLIIWKKMQQGESLIQPRHVNTRIGYRSRQGGTTRPYAGVTVRTTDHHQSEEASDIITGLSKMVVHIPTADCTTEDVDCPPNTPTPE